MPDYTTKYFFDFEVRAAEAEREIARLRGEIEKLRTTTAKAPATTTAVQLPWIEQFASAVQQAEIQYFGLRRLSYGLQSAGRDFTRYGQQIISSMRGMAEQYVEFADAATRAGIAMELPIEMQGELRDSVQATSEVLGAFDANQILETLRVWVAGTGEAITSTEQMNLAVENTTAIMRLAAINNVDAAATVQYVGAAAKEFGMDMSDVIDIVADLNYEAAKTFANVNDMGEALKYVGPIAAEMGMELEEVTTVLGSVADANIKASMAGRAMRQMLISLRDPSREAEQAFKDLLGIGWRELLFPEGAFRDFFEVIDLLTAATEDLSEAERAQALDSIFTANAISFVTALINEQRLARQSDINALRAQNKEKEGIIDAEVLAWNKLEEEITGMPQTIQNAVDLWTQSVAQWVESDSARANMLANRWKNAITDIGRIVFEEGIGPLEDLAEVLRDLADFLEVHPGYIEKGLQLGALAIGLGTVTSKAGELLQALTNILILSKLIGTTGFLGLLATAGAGAAGVGAALVGGYTLSQLRAQEAGLVTQFLEEERPTAELEQLARLGEVSPVLATAAQEALKIRRETQRTVTAVADWQMELADVNIAMREHRDMLAQMTGKEAIPGLPGVLDIEELTAAVLPTLEELEDKYGDLLDAYDKYLQQVEDKKEAFDKQTFRLEEEHQEDIQNLIEDRLDRRADLIESYEDRVQDAWRSYYRQLELAERDHQDRLLDIAEDAIEERAELIEQQAERLADTIATYELRVADAWEEYYYEEAEAAEDAAYRRQQIIDDYYEWEAEQRAQLAEDAEADQSDLNERLLNLHEDYLKDLQRAREDHLDRMWDLIARRDARGMLDELRDFSKWAQRREEDYKEAVEDATTAAEKQFEEEREARQRNLEEELKDFDEAEARAQEKRKKAFERRLYLMQRAHERELAEIKERNREELQELEERIRKQEQAENEAYAKSLARMKEAHQYQLSELRREHEETLREYDIETQEELAALDERHQKMMAKRREQHEEELREMEADAKEKLQAQYEALEYSEADLTNIFYERMRLLQKFLGLELDWIEEFYVTRMRELLGEGALSLIATGAVSGALGGAVLGAGAVSTATGGAAVGALPITPTTGGAVTTGAVTGTLGAVTGAAKTYSLTSPDPWERAIASLQQRGIETGITGAAAGAATAAVTGIIGAAAQTPTVGIAGTPTSGGAVPYEDLYRKAAAQYGLDWTLLAAQGRAESGFNPQAVSRAGAQGIAQFMPGTWPTWGGSGDPFNPADAIPAQAAFMNWLYEYMQSKGKTPAYDWAILGYLHGAAGALKYSSISSFPSSSRGYLESIKKYATEYRSKYGLAAGGLVSHPGIYLLAEKGPELVLPPDLTQFIMSKRGQGAASRQALVLQQNFTFRGSFTEGDKRWFLRASENVAYAAFERVIREASHG